MIQWAAIIYLIVAAIAFVVLMIIVGKAWGEDEEGEYPEEAANQFIAAFCIFTISAIMALMWPVCPIMLIGILIWDKIREAKE